MNGLTCPTTTKHRDRVLLGHGSGGRLTAELLRDVFLPVLGNAVLDRLGDSAVIPRPEGRLALTTDSFVVDPLRFPGGDIGSIAVNGTINDLAMAGAKPLGLSAAFVLEEGLPIDELSVIVASMGAAARAAGVEIIAADTKVVERGKADGMYITTTGIGVIRDGLKLGPDLAVSGDVVLVSGPIGDHGIAVLSAREGLEFATEVESDSAPLHGLVADLLDAGVSVHCLRDPTRGGVATTLHEIAIASGVEIIIEEADVRVRDGVHAACEMLGLDPMYVACEGRMLAVVGGDDGERALTVMRQHPQGEGSQCIGRVHSPGDERSPRLIVRTQLGTTRLLEPLSGEQLPRIC